MTRPTLLAATFTVAAAACGRTLPIGDESAGAPQTSPPPVVTPTQPSPFDCPFLVANSTARLALIASDGEEVHFLPARGGHARFIPSEALQGSATEIVVPDVHVAGSFVSVKSVAYMGPALTAEIALLSTDGSLRWRRESSSPWSPFYVSSSGTVAVDGHFPEVIAADGTVTPLPDRRPAEAVSKNGWLPALRRVSRDVHELTWREVATGAERPFAFAFTTADFGAGSVPRWIGDRLTYVVRSGDSAMVVLETTTGETTTVTLPPGSDQAGRGIVDIEGERWILLGDGGFGTTQAWRLDLVGGAAANVEIILPAGWSTGPTGMHPQSLGADGALFTQFTDAQGGTAAFRSGDLGRTWSRVGDVVPPREDEGFVHRALHVASAGGTLALSTRDAINFTQELSSAQIVHDGAVRHVSPLNDEWTQFTAPVALSEDGLCAAWWSNDPAGGVAVRVMDVPTGTMETVLRSSAESPRPWQSPATVQFARMP